MAEPDAEPPDSATPGGSVPVSGRYPPVAAEGSLFSADPTDPPGRSSSPPRADPRLVRDSDRRRLGSDILRRRNQLTGPPAAPVFDRVENGYDGDQVQTHINRLTAWSERESRRADSAEQTLGAMVAWLRESGNDLPTDPVRFPATRALTGTPAGVVAGGGRPPSRRGPRVAVLVVGAAIVLAVVATLYAVTAGGPTGSVNSGAPQLNLTPSQVTVGDPFSATASGFVPSETVQGSWTGPTSGRMDPTPTDRTGSAVIGPIDEREPPGDYVLTMTGLTSHRVATARFRVLPMPFLTPVPLSTATSLPGPP